MALKTWKCLECEKEFKTPNWICATGTNHVVEKKRYYMNDAPTVADASGRIDKHSTTQILNIPPERRTTGPDGNEKVIPGGSVWFVRGIYETDDPEKQHWLDAKGGWCSEQEWQAAFLNMQEKMQLKELDLAAREQRLQYEKNELLASVKARG